MRAGALCDRYLSLLECRPIALRPGLRCIDRGERRNRARDAHIRHSVLRSPSTLVLARFLSAQYAQPRAIKHCGTVRNTIQWPEWKRRSNSIHRRTFPQYLLNFYGFSGETLSPTRLRTHFIRPILLLPSAPLDAFIFVPSGSVFLSWALFLFRYFCSADHLSVFVIFRCSFEFGVFVFRFVCGWISLVYTFPWVSHSPERTAATS